MINKPSMKKHECIYCSDDLDQSCFECDDRNEKQTSINIDSNLYAAEFLLYAFHFSNHSDSTVQKNSLPVNPFMILAAEG